MVKLYIFFTVTDHVARYCTVRILPEIFPVETDE